MSGVTCYFGVTTSGKTTLALAQLEAEMNRDGLPALVLDCMPARNLRGYRHEVSVDAVINRLWTKPLTEEEEAAGVPPRPRKTAFYTPRDEKELDGLLGAVHAAGPRPRGRLPCLVG